MSKTIQLYKKIGGKYKHRDNLNVIFQLYKEFDKVVSVSKPTMELNKENLSKFTDVSNFIYTNNLVDVNYIEDKLNNIRVINIEDKNYILAQEKEKFHTFCDFFYIYPFFSSARLFFSEKLFPFCLFCDIIIQ